MYKRNLIIILIITSLFFSGCNQLNNIDNNNQDSGVESEINTDENIEGDLKPFEKSNNKWGFKNSNGEVVIEAKYDEVESFKNGLAKVINNGAIGFIDENGQFQIKENISRENLEPKKIFDSYVSSNNYGYINEKKEIVIEPKFEEVYDFDGELAKVKIDDKYGVVNKDGKMVTEAIYNEIQSFNEGLAKVKIDDKYGVVNKDGEMVIEAIYNEIQSFNEGLVGVKLENKWGYINKSGEIVVEPKFDEVREFNGKLTPVKENNKWGYINKNGEIVVDPKFDNVTEFNEELTRVRENNKWGYIDKNGEYAIDPKFHSVDQFSQGLAKVKLDNQYGYINQNGDIVVELMFDYISDFNNDVALVQENNHLGFVNSAGESVLPPQFTKIKKFKEGLAPVEKDNQWGFINESYELVIEPQFDYVNDFKNNKAKVIKDDQYSFIDKEGELIEDFQAVEFNEKYDELEIEDTNELLELINNKISATSQETADKMINDLIQLLEQDLLPKYQELKATGKLEDRNLMNYLIVDKGHSDLLGHIFFIDYQRIHEDYGKYLSNECNDYLEIKFNKMDEPLFIDAALAISLDDFVERLVTYEIYLDQYQNSKHSKEIADTFKIMMETLIYPNRENIRFFKDNNKPVEEFIDVYKDIINSDKEAQISKETAKRLLDEVKKSENNDLNNIDLHKMIEEVNMKIEERYLETN